MSNADKRYHVIISERAGEMLVGHARFLAQGGTQAADKLRSDVVLAAKSLQELPERGSRLTDPLLPANKYRKMLVDKRYLLIYQIKDDTVYIDYMVDCRQEDPAVFTRQALVLGDLECVADILSICIASIYTTLMTCCATLALIIILPSIPYAS